MPSVQGIALLAHEITHLGQNPLLAASVKGELIAYNVQYNVLLELGVNVSDTSPLTKIHNLLEGRDIDSLTDEQLDYGRKLIKDIFPTFAGYDYIPKHPPGHSSPKAPGGYGDPKNNRHLFD